MTVLSGESMSFVLIALASVVNSTVLDSDLLRRRCPLYVPQRGSFARPWTQALSAGCSSPFDRPWARRWINQWSLCCMASATPDLRLPSQPQSITAPWAVSNYTAKWQRHTCVNNLPKVVTWKRNGRDSNPRPSESLVELSDHYSTSPQWPLCMSVNWCPDLW